jgi:F0F1-type ATP synthase epsilon subunit
MIELHIMGPTSRRTMTVHWIGVETPTGNLIVQEGHAPMVTLLSPFKNLELGLSDGSTQQLEVKGGILSVNRTSATIIIDE